MGAGQVLEALQASLQEAHAKIKDADNDKRARESAKSEAEETFGQLKQAVVDHKTAIKNATKIIETKHQEIKAAKSSQKKASSAIKIAQSKKDRLDSVEQDCFAPLKGAGAQGTDGHKSLSMLRRAGKEFCFHEDLVRVMPYVLRKPLDTRQTFDGLVVEDLSKEFKKHADALDIQLTDRKSAADECSSALQEAQSDVQNA